MTNSLSDAAALLVTRALPGVVQVRSGRGGGAGIIWRADGRVLTNDHVLPRRRDDIEVVLNDGRTLRATVAARNPALDLALLTLDATDLPAATIGDSSGVRVGELVIAIGHPWGMRDVVTSGIVSGVGDLELGGGRTAPYIRSDVRLAPGNSGGPLLNARGEVIGINAMIFGGDLSVAIPTHVASAWLRTAEIRAPWRIGAQVRPAPGGLLVVSLDADGTAAQAGIQPDDVLLTANGEPLPDAAALLGLLRRASDRLTLLVRRGDTTTQVALTRAGAL